MVFPKVRQRLGSCMTSVASALMINLPAVVWAAPAHIYPNHVLCWLPGPNRISVCMCCKQSIILCVHHCAHAVVQTQSYVAYMGPNVQLPKLLC